MSETAPPQPPSPQPAAPASVPSPRPSLPVWVFAVLAISLLAGSAGRCWLASLGPRWAYLTDHFDNIQMGRTASQDGLFHVYTVPADRIPVLEGRRWEDANHGFVPWTRKAIRQVNYPPLGVTLFWLQSELLNAVAPGPVNTTTSRLVMATASIVAELAAAVAAFLIVRLLVGPKAGALAAAAVWLLPPLAMDSCFWGRTDGWFIAPALFTIYLMLRDRWVAVGVLSAVTVLLKPQGIFLGPIVLFAAAVLPTRKEEERRGAGITSPLREKQGTGTVLTQRGPSQSLAMVKRLAYSIGAGAAALVVLSLPWTIADGRAWADQAYLANVGMYNETTMKAFNVWYLEALAKDGDAEMVLDTDGTVMGITKGTWGMLLTIAALAAAAWACVRKFRGSRPQAVVLFSALWLWSTFLWPTKVHERYILYALPILLVAALPIKRLWPAVLALTLVASAELCHNVWMPLQAGKLSDPLMIRGAQEFLAAQYQNDPGRFPPPSVANAKALIEQSAPQRRDAYLRERSKTNSYEWLLVLLCLGGYAWAFALPFRQQGEQPTTPLASEKAPRPPRRK